MKNEIEKYTRKEQVVLDLFRGAEKISCFKEAIDDSLWACKIYSEFEIKDHGYYILYTEEEEEKQKLFYGEFENGDLLIATGYGNDKIYIKHKEVSNG